MFSVRVVQSSGDVRALHSFPTRRSSDLPTRISTSALRTAARVRSFRPALASMKTALQSPSDNEDKAGRSEEHTSELQSRGQLVCRLLLEKKKYLRPRK